MAVRKVNQVIRVIKVIKGVPNYLNYLNLLMLLFITSCANQVPPSGGPKDIKPPKALKTTPKNYSTRFTYHQVIVTFDEYIQLKDLSKQLIISPPLEKNPDATI